MNKPVEMDANRPSSHIDFTGYGQGFSIPRYFIEQLGADAPAFFRGIADAIEQGETS